MNQSLGRVSLVVREYDAAIAFFVGTLGFSLIEDTPVPEQNKQTLGRGCPAVFLFLHTDNFDRDYQSYRARGVRFVREPREEPYGRVAVFEDLYDNLWDLLQPRPSQPAA